jgi:hypothetical protein
LGPNAAILAVPLAFIQDLFTDEQVRRLLPIALATIAMVFMMLSLRRRQQQAQRPRREPLPAPRPGQVDAQLRRDLDELIMELQELARKTGAETDTRFAKLEAAIRDADRRIAVLNRLTRAQEAPLASDGAAAKDSDNRHQVVYELADAGFTAVEIARDLGRTPGEVELILNLRRRPEAARLEVGKQE